MRRANLPPRVLVRTCVKAPTEWSPHFSAFAPETIAWLASLGVKLVGIDSQSVDPADSKTLDSHSNCSRTTCACSRTWCSMRSPPATTS